MAAVAGRDLGVHSYYQGKIDEMELVVRDRTQNLERLKAQRNELNAKVRLLREELHHLQESGSYVGEVVKAMGKKMVWTVWCCVPCCAVVSTTLSPLLCYSYMDFQVSLVLYLPQTDSPGKLLLYVHTWNQFPPCDVEKSHPCIRSHSTRAVGVPGTGLQV